MKKRSSEIALETKRVPKVPKIDLESKNLKLRNAIQAASDEFICPITVRPGVGCDLSIMKVSTKYQPSSH